MKTYVRNVSPMEKEYLIRECQKRDIKYVYNDSPNILISAFYVQMDSEYEVKKLFNDAASFYETYRKIVDDDPFRVIRVDSLLKEDSIQEEILRLKEIYVMSQEEQDKLVEVMRIPYLRYPTDQRTPEQLINLLKKKD